MLAGTASEIGSDYEAEVGKTALPMPADKSAIKITYTSVHLEPAPRKSCSGCTGHAAETATTHPTGLSPKSALDLVNDPQNYTTSSAPIVASRISTEVGMAKNTGKDYRIGSIDNRSQVRNPRTEQWVKRDDETGRFLGQKADGTPYKGVAKERDGRKR